MTHPPGTVRAERSAVKKSPAHAPLELLEGFADLFDSALKDRIGADRHRVWFEQKSRFDWEGDCLIVGVPNLFIKNWIAKTFTMVLAATAADLMDRPIAVRFRIDPALFQASRAEQEKVAAEAKAKGKKTEDHREKAHGSP